MTDFVGRVIDLLSQDPQFKRHIAHVQVLPARDAVYGDIGKALPEPIMNYLTAKKIRLYHHQCAAIEAIRDEKNVVITTPTASGKTLAFNLPVFEALYLDQGATALYLYPTKALSNDQLKVLKEVEDGTHIKVNPNVYDGDTPQSKRPRIRESSRMVISNPYELHQVLPWHYKWRKFLSRLKFIVIDEAHHYRGVFGSNFSLVIRRLLRICQSYEAKPQFILATATLANPVEFSEKLVGRKFTLISEDGSPKGKKYFMMYNPFEDVIEGLSTHQETKDLFLFFVKNGLVTLCFTVSRRMAELVASWTKAELKKTGSALGEMVASYRAGYLPEERRQIENALKEGKLCGITSTNALELGIDIGSLDCVIISGYPGTIISTWQQAGRAGRGTDESAAVLVAFENPLDQYLMRHPDRFFGQSHEYAIIDLNNPYIVSGHLLCAAAEKPVSISVDRQYFGAETSELLDELGKQSLVKNTPAGWVYSGKGRPHDAVSLENITSDTFKVVCEGLLLETMDREHAFREGHTGAVMLHQGESYLVEDFDHAHRLIRVRKQEVDYFTQPVLVSDVKIIGEFDRRKFGDFLLSLGEVDVSEQYVKYKIKKFDRVIGVENLDLPPLKFRTAGMWLSIPQSLEAVLESQGMDFEGSLHGAEHALIDLMPFTVMCDAWDLGGLSVRYHPDTGRPTIIVHESVEGGIGLCEKGYELFDQIVKMTLELVSDCRCDAGCPSCIISPRCGNENRPLDKKGAIILLQELMKAVGGSGRS